MDTEVDKAAGQEVLVAKFLEEHRPLLKEPELSFAVLEATYVQGAGLLKSVSDELKRRQGPTVKAVNALTDALNERPRVAPKIARLEKKRKLLRGEFDRVNVLFELLEPFIAEVKARLDAEYEEDGTPKSVEQEEETVSDPEIQEDEQPEIDKRKEVNKSLSWWSRLLGINTPAQVMRKIARPYEGSPGLRESPTTLSPLESDLKDYQKLLDHYEVLLVRLEALFRTRGRHPVAYDIEPGLPERWRETYETLTNKMAWCDRNMDAIEERNAKVANSELASRRGNLASRRSELEE